MTLVHSPNRAELPEGWSGDVWQFYGVERGFEIVALPTGLGSILSKSRWLLRAARLRSFTRFHWARSDPRQPPYVWYGRSLLGATLAVISRRLRRNGSSCVAIVVELHDSPSSRISWKVLRHADAIVVISEALRQRVMSRAPELADRIWVEHDAADIDRIRAISGEGPSQARKQLRLPQTAMVRSSSTRAGSIATRAQTCLLVLH